ncbi:MAG: B12-binding domain-containing radical SAM protein [PVC group bacterium]|nr:B12-binding domain-containing radical SAM protein [PVC group bacterium]
MLRIGLISFLTNNLSIRLLSAYLKQNGVEVISIFCPPDFNEKKAKDIMDILKEHDVMLAGITLVTDDYKKAVVLTQMIKSRLNIPVIWGGAHPSVLPQESLRHADMVCIGEGEEALLELIKSLSLGERNQSIKNIWFKDGDNIVKNELRDLTEDLDEYPFPDMDWNSQIVITENGAEKMHEDHFQGEYNIITSRGCPYSCCYCYNSYRRQQYKGKGKYLRMRTIGNVIDELIIAKAQLKNVHLINFWDDSFMARSNSDFLLFKELYSKNINLSFFALAEPMAFNEAKVSILRECGLEMLQIGIQTGSERVNREVYNRRVTRDQTLATAQVISRLGIKVIYDVIFNNPYENEDDLRETVRLFANFPRPFALQGFNLIFYPGTEMAKRALKDGFISQKGNQEDFSTIQGRKNSPLSFKMKPVISGRFYRVNYDSRSKKYYNLVILLTSYLWVPRWIIEFFAKSKNFLKLVMLNLFIHAYSFLSRVKNKKFFVDGNNV